MSASASRSSARARQVAAPAARDDHRLEGPHGPERHHDDPVRRCAHTTRSPSGQLARQVVAEEIAAVPLEVRAAAWRASRGYVGHVSRAPRSGSADAGCCSPSSRPCSRTPARSRRLEVRRVRSTCSAHVSTTGRIADAAICASVRSWRGEKQMTRQMAGLRLREQQLVGRLAPAALRGRQQRREVVVEDEGRRVGGVALAARRACCPGTGSSRDRRRAARAGCGARPGPATAGQGGAATRAPIRRAGGCSGDAGRR